MGTVAIRNVAFLPPPTGVETIIRNLAVGKTGLLGRAPEGRAGRAPLVRPVLAVHPRLVRLSPPATVLAVGAGEALPRPATVLVVEVDPTDDADQVALAFRGGLEAATSRPSMAGGTRPHTRPVPRVRRRREVREVVPPRHSPGRAEAALVILGLDRVETAPCVDPAPSPSETFPVPDVVPSGVVRVALLTGRTVFLVILVALPTRAREGLTSPDRPFQTETVAALEMPFHAPVVATVPRPQVGVAGAEIGVLPRLAGALPRPGGLVPFPVPALP